MSISNAAESAIMKLVFQAIAWANYADNAAVSPEANIAVALHTADPGDAGTLATSEVTYAGYTRINVARSVSGWSESNGVVSPVSNIDFPAGTGGSGIVTHFSTGRTGGGAASALWQGTVVPSIVCGNGVTPRLTTASTLTLD
jgi:hypothetical protein